MVYCKCTVFNALLFICTISEPLSGHIQYMYIKTIRNVIADQTNQNT